MHTSALAHLELCVSMYLRRDRAYDVADLGSRSDPGATTFRDLLAGYGGSYVGLDVVDGPNVDVVMRKPYRIPLKSNSVDLLVTSQAFEHIPFFWATFLEIARVVRPGGMVFLCAPSRGHPHAAMDSWRYYPDSMRCLAAFARMHLLEAYTDLPPHSPGSKRLNYTAIDVRHAYWGDTVGVFRKPMHYSKLVSISREVTVWWANRVGGIGGVPRPAPRPQRGSAASRGFRRVAQGDRSVATARGAHSRGGAQSRGVGVAERDTVLGRAVKSLKVRLRARQSATKTKPAARPVRSTIFGINVTEVSFDAATYYVPDYGAHRPVALNTLARTHSEPELHAFVAEAMAERPGSMVHAGTFFGDMLPSFAAKCPGTLFAFEPVVENYLLARKTVDTNRLANVLLINAGLGAGTKVAVVETSTGTRHSGGGSRIVRDPGSQVHRPERIPIMAIDQFEIEDLTLIQLDVEGHELPALEGARRSIERCRPSIVIEDNRHNCEALLRSLGYRAARPVGARNTLYLPS